MGWCLEVNTKMSRRQTQEGPLSYENWKDFVDGQAAEGAYEHPFFTDAYITGEVTIGLGPYELLHNLRLPFAPPTIPALFLRYEYCQDLERPENSPKGEIQTSYARYHGGTLADEVAALVSLCLGIRLQAGGASRYFDSSKDSRGHPRGCYAHQNPIFLKWPGSPSMLPWAVGTHLISDLNEKSPLPSFPRLTPNQATNLMLVARLHQDGMWFAEVNPEISWLLFVSAVETAAEQWRSDAESPVERLKAAKPELATVLYDEGGEEHLRKVAEMIAPYMGATKKFIDFLLEFMPGPPSHRPEEAYQYSWERTTLKKSLGKIYDWRSKALHGGIEFPLPMCLPPFRHKSEYAETPMGTAMWTPLASWSSKDTPMTLHLFEYIVRNAVLRWWESMSPETNNDS